MRPGAAAVLRARPSPRCRRVRNLRAPSRWPGSRAATCPVRSTSPADRLPEPSSGARGRSGTGRGTPPPSSSTPARALQTIAVSLPAILILLDVPVRRLGARRVTGTSGSRRPLLATAVSVRVLESREPYLHALEHACHREGPRCTGSGSTSGARWRYSASPQYQFPVTLTPAPARRRGRRHRRGRSPAPPRALAAAGGAYVLTLPGARDAQRPDRRGLLHFPSKVALLGLRRGRECRARAAAALKCRARRADSQCGGP
jgi:hypothetical protein